MKLPILTDTYAYFYAHITQLAV
ncbi:protein of unknown function [Paenibacillus alvei]|uniref:Uncharacterized protein n=1 Tax=Paenibacillus alvei TaxID=44250 RepID=A0A383RIJ7_PAEAL|nr:protein of unknown function [Paenibacillus alvei]